jgi:hypothetical protein
VTLPIWIDEIISPAAWSAEFSKPEAREVISVLGSWIYAFRLPVANEDLETIKETMKSIQAVIERATGYGWDGTLLAVGMPQGTTPRLQMTFEEWDDVCREYNFEYIDAIAKGRNEFDEPVGLERLKEAIETTEWESGHGDLDDLLDERGDEGLGESGDWGDFSKEEEEMGVELLGLKSAICAGEGEEDEDEAVLVEEMGRLMGRLQAIKGMPTLPFVLRNQVVARGFMFFFILMFVTDTSSSMPEAEKKKFAAKAVNEIMKTL